MSFALCIRGTGGNWSAERWRQRLAERMPEVAVSIWPDPAFDPAEVRFAGTWRPEPGVLARFPNLEVIFNLGAGVDAVMSDPNLPDVPVVRVVADDLITRMKEYVLLHVLMYHRRQYRLFAAQRECTWAAEHQWPSSKVRVGIMGFGVLGQAVAPPLVDLGFQVSGWSNTRKEAASVRSFAGKGELRAFLGSTDILVALLPATPETDGILDAGLFRQLARDGVLGGPVLINAGRGALQNEDDILAALDDGTLLAATLDVFRTEPLPREHRFWTHPKVTISPHNAADSDPDTISDYVAAQLRAYEAGRGLKNTVDRKRGY
ncbi:MAG: hypothetical protein RLZ98_468 [Pseudomonadota bacterium]|jgi:glyoxylate/hydroxypyruvate reductase A